jgi:hypothetical protein
MKTPLEQIRGELAEMQYLLQEKPDMFIVLDELVLRSLHDPAIRQMITWLDEGKKLACQLKNRQRSKPGVSTTLPSESFAIPTVSHTKSLRDRDIYPCRLRQSRFSRRASGRALARQRCPGAGSYSPWRGRGLQAR